MALLGQLGGLLHGIAADYVYIGRLLCRLSVGSDGAARSLDSDALHAVQAPVLHY